MLKIGRKAASDPKQQPEITGVGRRAGFREAVKSSPGPNSIGLDQLPKCRNAVGVKTTVTVTSLGVVTLPVETYTDQTIREFDAQPRPRAAGARAVPHR